MERKVFDQTCVTAEREATYDSAVIRFNDRFSICELHLEPVVWNLQQLSTLDPETMNLFNAVAKSQLLVTA